MKNTNFIIIVFLLSLFQKPLAAQDLSAPLLLEYSKSSSVTAREDDSRNYLKKYLGEIPFVEDKMGNLVVILGSGNPKRLFTAPLDEPGYVVSQIRDDGYLRLAPVGYGHLGNLYHQFLEGHEVIISTETGKTLGISTVPSTHYEGLRENPERRKGVFQWQEAFIDVGAEDSEGVNALGIKLLDPVTLNKKPHLVSGNLVAAPSSKSKAAAIVMAEFARQVFEKKPKGTILIAWTTLELINGKGIETVLNLHGPFNEIYRFNRFLESEDLGKDYLIADAKLETDLFSAQESKPVTNFRNPSNEPAWGNARVINIGLPSRYANTPVEMVNLTDVNNLLKYFLTVAGISNSKNSGQPSAEITSPKMAFQSFQEQALLLDDLISKYGVSGDEGPVREFIQTQLPAWAKPVIDEKGNLILSFGQGAEHLVFVAHMDETGFAVDSIGRDGRLFLRNRGGFFPWLWEAQPAIIHAKTEINAIFEPRENYEKAASRNITSPLSVYAGFQSRSEALEAGIIESKTTVTMPKKMIRLSENKVGARGFDDRAGCAALIYSLKNLNPANLQRKITYIWSVEEEIGLNGATFAAKSLQDASLVYPVDTYVSSDSPMESTIFGFCPLGKGAVIRVLESPNFVNRKYLNYLLKIANENNITAQYGMTAGGTDGQPFMSYNIPSVPISWPGRYSHSPVEVLDLRDFDSLANLIRAIMFD